MEVKASPTANPAAITEAAEITSLWAESVDSNTGSVLGHCKRRKISSNSSDTEASSSCNLQPAKHRRKVLRKMAEDPHELSWEEQRTLSREELQTQHFTMINADVSPSNIKLLLEEAAEVVNDTPPSPKCYANPYFSVAECETIAKELSRKHNIDMSYPQVRKNLHSLFYAFEDYCQMMKSGKTGLSFCWETGGVSIQNQRYEMHDPIVSNLHQFRRRWNDMIPNFRELRGIYPFVWDRYFKDVSKKRSGSGMQSGSSKRSRGTSSSVNNFRNDFGQVMARLRQFFGKGPDKRLPKAYVDAAVSLYGHNHIECNAFMANDDDDAKESFLTKIGVL